MRKVVESALGSLLKSETYADIHAVIESAGGGLGYGYFGYQYWPGSEEYGDWNFAGVVQCNYPQAWMSRYVERSYYDIDPVRLFGLARDGVAEWNQLEMDDAQRRMMADAARYDVGDGVVGSFHDSENGRLQLAFAGPEIGTDARAASEALRVLGPVMTVCFRKAHHLESRIRWLTERQRDAFFQLRRAAIRGKFADYR